mmetsp:Transcript_22803/g.53855  ORF Transcript_22803/g.53855 Transcript_22803/m.53855 type:complete len:80 (-) Transcript_22803:1856-2095(-)
MLSARFFMKKIWRATVPASVRSVNKIIQASILDLLSPDGLTWLQRMSRGRTIYLCRSFLANHGYNMLDPHEDKNEGRKH